MRTLKEAIVAAFLANGRYGTQYIVYRDNEYFIVGDMVVDLYRAYVVAEIAM